MKSPHWGTPKKYVEAIRGVFGGRIALDPCSNEYSVVGAEVAYQLPWQDGLIESWDYPTIYVNPPYGFDIRRHTSIKHWLAKCVEAYKSYGAEVLALIPVATNTRHWKDSVFRWAEAVCFLCDTRLKFLENGQVSNKGAPMACAMVYWGNNYQKFHDVFINHGAVVRLEDNCWKERACAT